MTPYSTHKLTIDFLLSISATLLLSTTIWSVSTNSWNVRSEHPLTNRTGLFRECSNTLCCETKELDRSITLLALLSIILLATSALSSFLLMSTAVNRKNRYYILVPLTLFSAGITMTLTLIQIIERLHLNGYSAYTFILDTIAAYVVGGLSLLHANLFYF